MFVRITSFVTIIVAMIGGSVLAQDDLDMGVPLNTEVSGTVEFWHFWGSEVRRNAINEIIDMCETALPNIDVQDVFKPWGDIWTANIAAVAAGSGMPDVIVEDRPQLASTAAAGIAQSLQPFIDQDGIDSSRFWPFTWQQTLYEGNSYGIPFETDVRVLFYNKSLFEEAGLDPNDPPETWEELEQYADQLDQISEDGTIERMAFFPLIGNVGPDVWAQSAGHTWHTEGQPNINTQEVVDTFNWINSWIERYGGWDNVQQFRANFAAPPNDAFMTGDVAMFVDIGGYASTLDFYQPEITLGDGTTEPLDWGVAFIPYRDQPTSSSGGFALSIPTGADNPEAAWEFIKCATSPAAQLSWAQNTFAMPSDISAANNESLTANPNWQLMVDAMEVSSAWPFVAEYPNWKEQLDQRYEQIWQGSLSPEQAAQEAQQAVDETMAQNQ